MTGARTRRTTRSQGEILPNMIITIIDRHMPITLVTRTRELAFLTLMSEVELEEEGEEAELDVGKADDRGKA